VIITDHHTIPERLPEDAFAILHPKMPDSNYPYKELTGAGVAFKLAQALIRSTFERDVWEVKENSLVDLASMGTISDLGPLTGENRLIVKKGLQIIPETKNFGLKKIIELSGIDVNQPIDTYTIGFKIGPRINAAGRIDSPYVALQLLLQDENSDRLHSLGEKLESLNKERQLMMEKALKESKQKIISNKKSPFVIMDFSPDWHVGILGLVAGRLAEKYFRPAIIMQDFGDTLVASARSPEYFNIVEALTELKDYLITFGGHASAAGFSLKKENYDIFYEKMQKFAEDRMKDRDLRPSLEIDCTLSPSDIDFELIEKIAELEPFGVKNSKPVFLLKNVTALDLAQVGRENKHLKFSIQTPMRTVETIAFEMGEYIDDLREHNKIDLVFHLDKSFWKNSTSIKLQALDIDFSNS
jgi:single-stranded-DNA-specific exonuclease